MERKVLGQFQIFQLLFVCALSSVISILISYIANTMSQRQKQCSKNYRNNRHSQNIDSKTIQMNIEDNNPYSQKFIRSLDGIYERLQVNMKLQNMKIDNLENKYLDALIGRFDTLISVNQKIGKNLERLVQKFDYQEEKPLNSQYFLPPINQEIKTNDIGFKALSSRRLLKSRDGQISVKTPRKLQTFPSQFKVKRKSVKKKDKPQQLGLALRSNSEMIQVYQLQLRNMNKEQNIDSQDYIREVFEKIVQFNCSDQILSTYLNKIIGRFHFQKTQFYYSQYTSGRLQYEDMKIKFSTDIINQAMDLSKRWMDFILQKKQQKVLDTCIIKGKDFFRFFNQASKNALEYLIHKYPPSRTKQIDTQLSERIKQIKTFSVIKYDLLKNAGVDFGQTKGQTDFSTEIKQWVNRLITQTKKQFPAFKQKMKDIFTNNQGSLDGSKIQNEVEYMIGSKLPQNTSLYTQEQLELPGLPIQNPEVLRVLIKWFQELYSYFTNTQQKILNNKHGFKSNRFKNVPIRIPHSKLQKLVEKLSNIYQTKVGPFKKSIFRNLGELLQGLIATSMAGVEGYDFLDQREVTITKLASILYETFKEYILIFLNGVMSFLVDLKSQYDKSQSESVINLITFTLMDLLRCKCTGTKKQIYRIYNEILEKKDYFQVIRVKNKLNEPTRDILINLKLKNSFLVCEVQLSLGSNQQEKNDHFCHFLYQLQRSKFGSLFQCASQIANLDPKVSYIRKHKDLKFKQFSGISEILKTKLVIKNGSFYCSVSHVETKMQLVPNTTPFCCIYCNSFIESNRLRLPYFKCFKCAVCICTQCIGHLSMKEPSIMATVFENTDCDKKCIPDQFYKGQFVYNGCCQPIKVRQQLKKVLQTNQYAVLCIVNKAGCHQILYKKYKQSIIQAFSTIQQLNSQNLDQYQRTSLSCIVTLQQSVKKNIRDLQGYMKYHISMQWQQLYQILKSRQIQQVICVVNQQIKSILIIDIVQTQQMIQNMRLQRTLCQTMKRINKNNQTSLDITSKKVDNLNFLSLITNKKAITAINLWQNKIQNINILSQFTSVQQLYLQQNIINVINPILTLNKIQVLGLSQNNLSGPLPKLVMPNLQCLILSNNKISDISNLSVSPVPHLTFIKLYKNPLLTQIPQLDFFKLQVILLNDCGINNIGAFSKSKLPNLKNLQLSNNQIEGILTDFNFPQLTNLHLSKNKISSLNIFINSKLPKLRHLDLRYNQISDSISELNLPQLRQLLLANNRIKHIGQQILYCKKLPLITTIDLRYNSIGGKLPKFKLKTLKKLDFGFNKLSDISQLSQTIFHSIQQIKLDHNQIQCKLPSISFKTLKTIDLSYNFLSDVCCLQSWNGHNIQDIKLNNNKITCSIPKVQMYSLKYLNLSNNHIKEEKILQNIHLTPEIVKINYTNNSVALIDSIRKRYDKNSIVGKAIDI